ncbi:hypothetical protein [Microbispora amethystogenes]|uniref:Uncharacterized protein n=1 Tax=Microbispora amethystogenes TaxID=1427754 RepID=A0ABQ4F8D3_9ACTN|nr:hypothetical protein [Microbispora amethystogenes]GIH31044.1 hypothetical protein Mam01_12080 [Microbispora amethystogenes]
MAVKSLTLTRQDVHDMTVPPTWWRPARVRLPDWAALRSRAESRGAADAGSKALDTVTIKTQGFEPQHLLVLDAERQLALEDLNAQFQEQELAARSAQAAHVKRSEAVREQYVRDRTAYEMALGRVERLELGPSQWVGDGRPSSIALGGGWREMLRLWGVPALLLLVLLTIEVPIYYATFLAWGDTTIMTYALAVGAIFVFVFGPHMYGRSFREWQEHRGRRRRRAEDDEEGEDGRGRRRGLAGRPVVLFLIPVIWLAAIGAVVSLRLVAIAGTTEITLSGTTITIPPATEGWKLFATVVLFLALMIFTALIATELGRRTGNPNDRDLKEQRMKLQRAAQALEIAQARQEESDRYGAELGDYLATLKQKRDMYTAQIDGGFDHVETIYMDALIGALDDPDASRYGPAILDRHQRRHYTQADS